MSSSFPKAQTKEDLQWLYAQTRRCNPLGQLSKSGQGGYVFRSQYGRSARIYFYKSTASGAASPASATIFDSIPDAFCFGYLLDAPGRLPPKAREDKERERSTKPALGKWKGKLAQPHEVALTKYEVLVGHVTLARRRRNTQSQQQGEVSMTKPSWVGRHETTETLAHIRQILKLNACGLKKEFPMAL